MDRDLMNRDLYVRRRSRRTDARPALMWFTLTLMLLLCAAVGFFLVRTVMGDWLDLKMESARVRVMEMLPQPDRPDFVPTPILQQSATAPTIVWNKNLA